MRWLVWWIRSIFCNHTWDFCEQRQVYTFEPHDPSVAIRRKKDRMVVSATCTKCGWHRCYVKFPEWNSEL